MLVSACQTKTMSYQNEKWVLYTGRAHSIQHLSSLLSGLLVRCCKNVHIVNILNLSGLNSRWRADECRSSRTLNSMWVMACVWPCCAVPLSAAAAVALFQYHLDRVFTFTYIFLLHIIFLDPPIFFSSCSALPVVSSLSFCSNYPFLSITHLLTHSPLLFFYGCLAVNILSSAFSGLRWKNMPQSSGGGWLAVTQDMMHRLCEGESGVGPRKVIKWIDGRSVDFGYDQRWWRCVCIANACACVSAQAC